MAQLPWGQAGPVLTVAASPLVSPWLDCSGHSQVVPWFAFAGGTSVHSIEGSFDGVNVDTDAVYGAPTSGTPFTVLSPFIRWKTVQTVADATKSKIYLRARP
jgi:hypothetical protein